MKRDANEKRQIQETRALIGKNNCAPGFARPAARPARLWARGFQRGKPATYAFAFALCFGGRGRLRSCSPFGGSSGNKQTRRASVLPKGPAGQRLTVAHVFFWARPRQARCARPCPKKSRSPFLFFSALVLVRPKAPCMIVGLLGFSACGGPVPAPRQVSRAVRSLARLLFQPRKRAVFFAARKACASKVSLFFAVAARSLAQSCAGRMPPCVAPPPPSRYSRRAGRRASRRCNGACAAAGASINRRAKRR